MATLHLCSVCLDLTCIFAAFVLIYFRGDSMSELGDRLKESREKIGLSQKKVFEMTGITDSRLSKMERGQIACSPEDLRRLSDLYNVNLIPLYKLADYLNDNDIREYQFVFRGVSSLDDEEMQHIQAQIDFLNKKRKVDEI